MLEETSCIYITPVRKPVQLRLSSFDLRFITEVDTNIWTRAFSKFRRPYLYKLAYSYIKASWRINKYVENLN